jgi:hypothetical protein
MGRILHATPFVTSRMIETIDALYARHSHLAVFYQSFSFMQFKIWTHLAVKHELHPVLYFVIVMISRAARLGAVALVARFFGRRLQGVLDRHGIVLTVAYTLLFVAMLFAVEGG